MPTKIPKVTPEVSELTQDKIIQIEEAAEYHKVPFGAMPVDAFSQELIREAAAQYWEPEYYADGDKDSDLKAILWNVFPQGLEYRFGERENIDFPVEVRIVLTYPLNEYWEATVKIAANRFGEIFAIAHDMYRHIYDLDDSNWQSQGHQDSAPSMSPKIMNRAQGKHVWGHDMSDLVFETVGFLAPTDWGLAKRREHIIIDCTDDDGNTDAEKLKAARADKEPRYKDVLEPLGAKHRNACPFVGTVFFGIGS